MTAVAAIEPELSRHWVKRLARRMGVPVETARRWTYQRMPDARRQEIALALLEECTRLEALIAETRERWKGVADEAGGAALGGAADRRGKKARRMGG